MYQPRASVPLDELAKLIGFPGKLGMDGSKVWGAWLAGGMRPKSATTARPTCSIPTSFAVRFRLLRGEGWRDRVPNTMPRCPSCAASWRKSANRTGRSSWLPGQGAGRGEGGKAGVFGQVLQQAWVGWRGRRLQGRTGSTVHYLGGK
jgi:hypothetical protein